MSIALAVVDTAEFNRIGIREIVSASDTVRLAGEFARLEELYIYLKATPVDIVVLGNTQAYVHLVNDLKQLYQSYPHLKVLLMANNFGTEQIEELSNLGVMGFICKDEQSDTLILAIRLIIRGEVFLSPKVASTLFRASQDNGNNPLNPRQMQVVRLMAAYLTPQEIAMKMAVSTRSVYSLQYRIRQVLNIKTTAQILIEAMKRGWIKEDY